MLDGITARPTGPKPARPRSATTGLATTSAGDDDVALEVRNAANGNLRHASPPDVVEGNGFPILNDARWVRKNPRALGRHARLVRLPPSAARCHPWGALRLPLDPSVARRAAQ